MIRFWTGLKNRFFGWADKFPSHTTIDKSGILKSDHPTIGNGWMKGFAVSKTKAVIIKHAGPSTAAPNNKVFFTDKNGIKVERTIINVDRHMYMLDGRNEVMSRGGEPNYYFGGDFCICTLNEPLPDTVAVYEVSTSFDMLARRAQVFNQYGKHIDIRIHFSDNLAWIFGKKPSDLLIGGDSGMPWFVYEDNKWKVLTVTSRGLWGEGPYFGHKLIYKKFMDRVNL